MGMILDVNDMLDAASTSGVPNHDELSQELEAAADALANALAQHLGVITLGAHNEGMAYGGLAASFYPAEPGQKCPSVLLDHDTSGDWEG